MSTETEPVDEPETRERPEIPVETMADEVEVDAEEEEGAGEETGEAEPAAEAVGAETDEADPEPKKRQPWQVKRIGKLTKDIADRDATLAEKDAKIAALEAAQTGEGGGKLYTEDEVRTRIDRESTQKANAERINQRLDSMFDAGSKAHKDFAQRVDGYVKAFGTEALQARPDFFETVAELDNGADVIHALGGDLDHMAEILEMPPHKMGKALAELSATLAKAKSPQVSKAPAPIRPLEVINKSELAIDDPKLPMDEYVRRRREARVQNGARR